MKEDKDLLAKVIFGSETWISYFEQLLKREKYVQCVIDISYQLAGNVRLRLA